MSNRPNVIFVFSDQHRAEACGYAGNKDVITPNMDRLASESISITHAVSGMPVCCPYRASLITGQFPHHHGLFLNDVCLNLETPSIGEVYKNYGYETAYVGKWHMDGNGRTRYIPRERGRGFEYRKLLECTHDYNHSIYYENDNKQKKVWEEYDAIAQTKDVISYLKNRDQEKPLFLMLSWGPPHPPYDTAPEKFRKLYDFSKLKQRENVPLEAFSYYRNLPGYYAHITAIDECLGMLMDAVDGLGMRDNTVFIYTSDHGDMLGSQGVHEKQSPWDESIRVPFLLRYPKRFGLDERKMELPVNVTDIMPTLLELCDLPCPDSVDGESVLALLNGNELRDREVLLQSIQPNGTWHKFNGGREYRGIRTKRYTYVEDLKGPWLLYDNAEDPLQINNLVEKANHGFDDGSIKALHNQLQILLKKKLKEAGDEWMPGRFYLKKWDYLDKVNFLNTYPIE